MISLIEDGNSTVEEIMRAIYPRTGRVYAVGLTGPPGAGKSSLADELIRVVREHDLTVGVLAVDPNSPFTGGAILGDRIRMMRHSTDPGVYIRSMGARGHLGGLSEAAQAAVSVMDAMGKDIVILETVGVGQGELEVAGEADSTVVVIPPGLGDGVQAIKAGIMEIADIFVVNKADLPLSDKAFADIRDLLRMEHSRRPWTPPIVKTVATEDVGLEDLWTRIVQHRQYQERSGELQRRRRSRLERVIIDIADRRIREQVLRPRTETREFNEILDAAMAREIDPYQAADRIVPAQAADGE